MYSLGIPASIKPLVRKVMVDSGTSQSTGTEETKGFQIPTDLPAKKVGAVGIYTGNELYVQWKENLTAIAEMFNVEVQFVDVGNGEDLTSAVENLCTAGIDGVVVQSVTESLVQKASEYGVPGRSVGIWNPLVSSVPVDWDVPLSDTEGVLGVSLPLCLSSFPPWPQAARASTIAK